MNRTTMILRLGLNEMDLQRRKHILAVVERQPDHLGRIFGHGAARPPTS
jgi:hypothetical protein